MLGGCSANRDAHSHETVVLRHGLVLAVLAHVQLEGESEPRMHLLLCAGGHVVPACEPRRGEDVGTCLRLGSVYSVANVEP